MPIAGSPLFNLLSSWDTRAFTGALVIGLPCFAYSLFKGARGKGYFGMISKSGTYLWIIGSLWVMVFLLAAVAYRHRLSTADLGEHLRQPPRLAAFTALLLLIFSMMSFLDFRKHKQMPPAGLAQRLADLKHFFPTSRAEIVAFAALAVSAGICEELLYRGWLLNVVAAWTGSVWIGLLISSVAFGLGHAYQGPRGMVSAGFVGLIFGLIFMWLGSLVPIQILHASINLSSGLMCAYLLARVRSSQHVEHG